MVCQRNFDAAGTLSCTLCGDLDGNAKGQPTALDPPPYPHGTAQRMQPVVRPRRQTAGIHPRNHLMLGLGAQHILLRCLLQRDDRVWTMRNIFLGSRMDWFFKSQMPEQKLKVKSRVQREGLEDFLKIKLSLDPHYDHYHRTVYAI